MSNFPSINLEMKIQSAELFNAMKNSDYIKKRGYEILYAKTLYEEIKVKVKEEGVKIEKIKKGKPIEYRICYSHPKEWIYLHIFHLKAKKRISKFSYLIALGDEKQAESDLIALVKEIKKKFSKK